VYRLFNDDGRPLLSCDDVYQRYATNTVETLHEKNLYHLGEDRMLTTLLLRYFPDMKLSFVPEASCYTIVPHTFSVLLSQRRRWINSTFHNMLELLRVNTMCGVCCLSMKSIVLLDLVATLILPASLIYIGYIVYITVYVGEQLSLLMMVVWGIVIGVQVVVFLLRSRWDYWWWFIIFVVAGVPVFYFILPLYSFWHMDDFSWGTTRQVSGASPKAITTAESGDTIAGRDSPDEDYAQQRVVQSHKVVRQAAKRPSVQEEVGKLNLKPKLHSSIVDCDEDYSAGDASKTTYDPNKYRDAEEAKMARRLRRGEC
jgi:chitin synthase